VGAVEGASRGVVSGGIVEGVGWGRAGGVAGFGGLRVEGRKRRSASAGRRGLSDSGVRVFGLYG
jgi:hypothetical protein